MFHVECMGVFGTNMDGLGYLVQNVGICCKMWVFVANTGCLVQIRGVWVVCCKQFGQVRTAQMPYQICIKSFLSNLFQTIQTFFTNFVTKEYIHYKFRNKYINLLQIFYFKGI